MRTERIILGIGIIFSLIFCAVLGIMYSSSNKEVKKLQTNNVKITKLAELKDALAKSCQEEKQMYKNWYIKANDRIDTLSKIAKNPDSLREVVEASMDRLSEANDSLQNKLDEATANAARAAKTPASKSASDKKAVTTTPGDKTTVAKVIPAKLKGHPITNDKNRTFTYVASDSALIATLAPTGYKLIKKPR